MTECLLFILLDLYLSILEVAIISKLLR